jgi:hypothetical protein
VLWVAGLLATFGRADPPEALRPVCGCSNPDCPSRINGFRSYAHLRSYDLIVRFGGDESVCALLALDVDRAAERFTLIRGTLAA